MKQNRAKLMTIALLAGSLLLGGCGGGQPPAPEKDSSSQTAEAKAEPKPLSEVYQEISATVALESPSLMDDDFIMNYYGIDSSLLEEYVFSLSEDATKAEAVILMKAKEAGDLEALKICLQTVVDEKKNEMENYLPEQFAIVEQSKVQTEGRYVWLVISEQSDAILAIIEKYTAE